MHHYNYIHTWPQIHSLKFYSVVFIVLNVCTMYSSMYVILIAIVIMFFFCSSHAVAYRGHFDWGGGCLFQNLPTKLNKNHAKMTYLRIWKCVNTWHTFAYGSEELTIGVFTIITGVASRFTTRGETRICRPQTGHQAHAPSECGPAHAPSEHFLNLCLWNGISSILTALLCKT